MLDTLIRGGTLVDGSGEAGRTADVGIKEGRIVEVGRVSTSARRTIDADGLTVAPGWVDIHTHYDGQVCWDRELAPSSVHGVTSVVMGNCGVGFAPVRPGMAGFLINLMEGVEDIPGTALHEGIDFSWESFPEYLDAIDREYAIDVAAQIPHGALRAYVMGERAAELAPATSDEAVQMGRLVTEGLKAGALGFTTSRTILHRAADGGATPSLKATAEELAAIADGVRAAGTGVFEWISDFADLEEEWALLEMMTARSGRGLTFSLMEADQRPGQWREMLARIDGAQARGLNIRAQVAGRPVGLLLGLSGSIHPFVAHPSFAPLNAMPLSKKVAALSDAAFQEKLLGEEPNARVDLARFIFSAFQKMFPLGAVPDYEPSASMSVAAEAVRRGIDPRRVVIEHLLADDGRGFLYFPLFNYTHGNLHHAREMMLHPHTVFGLGDGGAHVGTICDGSFPTFMATHWTRDRAEGRLPFEWIVKRQARDTALAVGLGDRGLIAPGMRADINLIDREALALERPEMAHDLPAGGKRLVQQARGYAATLCAGEVTFQNGEATGALPGRLVRGERRA
jgi:N-acyl-D-aspartate/D-glutamate deacylase